MSVALHVKMINGEKADRYIPVSGEKTFEKYWIPICEKYDLPFLGFSTTGQSYTETELPALINEVSTFCNALKANENIPQDILSNLKERSTRLLEELKRLEGTSTQFFLG